MVTSRTVAQDAASRSGLQPPPLMKKMLPMVAMMLAGHMAKQAGTGGPAGGLAGLLRGGNPLDDILRMAGGARR